VYQRPWRMAPDNFTPPSRTPWGGQVIRRLKAGLPLAPEKAAYPVVGESWEISVEPSFPSRVVDLPRQPLLSSLLEADPVAALGPAAAVAFGGCPLLVKLLDAALPLSVQVHPADDHPGLAEDESGKAECWVILDAAPGAGLYLGFCDGVTREDVAHALSRGQDLERLLNFVPVTAGDCFELAPGTVHAIGAGVTLVEPQAVRPGKKGLTYRFWDWNRRYNRHGQPDPDGEPRPLHRESSLAVTDFDGARGVALVESLRRGAALVEQREALSRERLVDGSAFRVERLRGSGRLSLEVDRLLGAVVVKGHLTCETAGARSLFQAGESFVLPAALRQVELVLDEALALVSAPGTAGTAGSSL
jgi:mannose-6-phosphate isomerase